ncbi:SH3 domain-containing kinase-binding protein 1 [Asbolus verrucosus]|uniref:SH3 domain-containing kinase-binding protein 1 n=1 Tax=Asbolus verrucosus TaxID=1661398 RepID=A0A482VMV1_ASBVE|nr:SH3 domain-containing kinase-binding protein 1 [Asbolus verrucosus]
MFDLNIVPVEVLVEHDYVAKEPNELTITKGDIIKDVIKKQGGWWEGTLKEKKGLFPDNFVKVIDRDSSVVLRNRKDASRIRQCRVVFSYKQDHEDELNLNVGDIIDILGEEEEGWWRGVLHGRQGVFPSNFVEEIVPVPSKITSSKENLTTITGANEAAPPLFAKPTKILCEVRFPYKAQNEDELTLKEGDLVTLLSKDGQDPGWWKGELNGVIGVFPDNFVTVVQINEENPLKDEKRPKAHIEPTAIKPVTISSQRKSLEVLSNDKDAEISSIRTTPPLPGKKPTVPIKKSPSSSGSSGGIFYGLKKKLVDVVDGATSSKNISPPKTEPSSDGLADNAFDDVHRRPLLSDVRATRPKAPGRRPPSMVGKDSEPGVMNGSTEHTPMEVLTEATYNLNSTAESDGADNKPKLREWEKHRAPWLEEMKLNQAKRVSGGPPTENKLKLTPTDRVNSEADEGKASKAFEKEPSPIDKSKSISGLSNRMKTPTNEFPMIRNKPNVPIPSRPQTIQNIASLSDVYLQKQTPKVSPIGSKTPSPLQKSAEVADSNAGGDCAEEVPQKQYWELEQRIARLEELLEKQQQMHEAAIEELKGKLQIETEMRMKLQVKFERFSSDGAIQQL